MPEADVFVSHAGRDRAWAEWVGWQLERAGLSVELDYWDWRAGENFVTRMNNALRSCKVMVALFSEAYFEATRWTTEEWTAALVVAKKDPARFVPVRIADAPVPEILGPMLAPALFDLPAQRAREELLRAVRGPTRPDVEPPFPGLDLLHPAAATGDGGPRLPGVLPSVWGGVPSRNVGFTGRDGMLVRLREGLSVGGRSVVQALHGMGGVGKTQLAAEHAWRFANDYDAVWWAAAEQTDLIGEQLAEFATELGVVEQGTATGPAVKRLFQHLGGRGRWLVVLDNAESEDAIRPWVPAGPGHVVITSRSPHWSEVAAAVEVDVFARAESVALLRGQVPTLSAVDADRLAAAVGDLPLAVAQAAGLIAETGMPAAEYLQLLDRSAAEVLAEGRPGSYPVPLAAAVRVSHDRLAVEDEAAGQMLVLCAFLGPEPIPAGWFAAAPDEVLPEPLGTVARSRLAFRRTLGRIGRYGLARIGEDRLQLHRLTQAVLRHTLSPGRQDTHAATVQALLGAVNPGDPNGAATWPGWADLLPHLRAVDLASTTHADLRGRASNVAWYLLRRGDTQAGMDLAQHLHDAWTTRLGPDHEDTLVAANCLAGAHRSFGQYQQARSIDQDTLARRSRILGEDHQATLDSANNLADDLRRLGKVAAARELDEDTLARYRRVLGDDHPNTLTSANNLAYDLYELGDVSGARELHQENLARSRRVYGDDHHITLAAANGLGQDLRALGEVQAAYELHQDTLTRRRRILGDDHPNTLRTADNLAADLRSLGEVQAARELDEDTLARRRGVLGDDHPDTLTSASNLAIDLRQLGEVAAAQELEAEVQQKRRG